MEFEKLIEEIESEGLRLSWKVPSKNKKRFAVVGSWQIPKNTGLYLHDMIIKNKPKNILELGTSTGYSTLWLAHAAKKVGAKVHTIEYFKPKIEVAKNNFRRAKLSEYIILHEGMIMEVLKSWNEKVDFVFFDADKQRYPEYFELIRPWFSYNAMIVVDNAVNFADRMKKFFAYLKNNNIAYEILDFDNGLMISNWNSSDSILNNS